MRKIAAILLCLFGMVIGTAFAATPTVDVNVGNYINAKNVGSMGAMQTNNVNVQMASGKADITAVNGFSGKNIGFTCLDQDNQIYGKIGPES